jgi:hypothetical protein
MYRHQPGGTGRLGSLLDSAILDFARTLRGPKPRWKLIRRTEEDMNRLFSASRFGRPCTAIRFEETGINLFAKCVRAQVP